MKKSLLALAVLGAFAGAASAQSSVTLYGKLDLGLGKTTGSADKQVLDTTGSRFGLKGEEDLGGGLKAVFGFEHRFDPDTGSQTSALMWNGYSTVGLKGAFGTVNLGRQYSSSFSLVQNAFDPWGGNGDLIGGLRDTSLRISPARLRVPNSVRYDGTFGGLSVAADIAERSTAATAVDRPYSVAAQYAAGPLKVGLAYENPEGKNDKLINAAASYAFGPATGVLGVSSGRDNSDNKISGLLVGASVNVGAAGHFLAGYAQNKVDTGTAATTVTKKKASLGYRQDLSKRTYLYTDVTRVNTATSATERTGYDFGIQHNF